ncbi:MAG TPA: hypothetical protein DCY40_05670 [Actinobacteria bacterium]|nr:hypothetical protein [Actinomycetota bacterium]
MWRAHPDGTLQQVLRTDPNGFNHQVGKITLYQVPMIGLFNSDSAPRATPIYKFAPDVLPERVGLAPAGRDDGGGGIGRFDEGSRITGIGWQEATHRLIIAVQDDASGWLETWDFDDTPPVDWPSEWPTNPAPPGTPCPDDDGVCFGSVTTLPGTTLIAYTVTGAAQTTTDLVIYSTEYGAEVERVHVAEGPVFVKLIHASPIRVVLSLVEFRGGQYRYLPAVLVDIAVVNDPVTATLPIPGVTTIVPLLPG